MSKTILTIDNLYLTIQNKTLLKGIDINIWEGHIHAIIGPNGAGKSTLVSTLWACRDINQNREKFYFWAKI
jgi:Fe-S cluster assembly ATP-binding protein